MVPKEFRHIEKLDTLPAKNYADMEENIFQKDTRRQKMT